LPSRRLQQPQVAVAVVVEDSPHSLRLIESLSLRPLRASEPGRRASGWLRNNLKKEEKRGVGIVQL
jgi:hypothetical protein